MELEKHRKAADQQAADNGGTAAGSIAVDKLKERFAKVKHISLHN